MKDNNIMEKKAAFPQNNELNENEDESMEQDINEEDEEDVEDYGDMTPEEFHALNNKMDELNSALDNIEQKNEVIYSELLKLLQSNREIRQQMEGQATAGEGAKSTEQ